MKKKKLTANQKDKIITDLVANCECWNSAEQLEDLDNQTLIALHERMQRTTGLEAVIGNLRKSYKLANGTEPTFADLQEFALNAKPPMMEDDEEDEDEEEETPPKAKGKKPPFAKNQRAGNPNIQEWMKSAPKEVQAMVRNAMDVSARESAALIDRLTANIDDPKIKARKQKFLMNMEPEELRELAELMPDTQFGEPLPSIAHYLGQNGAGPVANEEDDAAEDDILPLPVYNWDGSEGDESPRKKRQSG